LQKDHHYRSVLLIRATMTVASPHLANLVDMEGVEALGAPAGHHSAAIVVVDVEG
jgi:hypothetical protein